VPSTLQHTLHDTLRHFSAALHLLSKQKALAVFHLGKLGLRHFKRVVEALSGYQIHPPARKYRQQPLTTTQMLLPLRRVLQMSCMDKDLIEKYNLL